MGLYLARSVLSDYKSPQDVRKDLIASWIYFFNGVPGDVIQEHLRQMEDHIAYLHDKGGGSSFCSSLVPEKYWYCDQHDYLYAQYISPLHLAAWCGYFEFFTFICTKYPTIWNCNIYSRDIIGNLPVHVSYFSCDSWSTPIVVLRVATDS